MPPDHGAPSSRWQAAELSLWCGVRPADQQPLPHLHRRSGLWPRALENEPAVRGSVWGLQGAGPGAPFWVSGGVSSLSILEGHSWGNVSGNSSGGHWAAGRTTAHTRRGRWWEGSFPRRRVCQISLPWFRSNLS